VWNLGKGKEGKERERKEDELELALPTTRRSLSTVMEGTPTTTTGERGMLLEGTPTTTTGERGMLLEGLLQFWYMIGHALDSDGGEHGKRSMAAASCTIRFPRILPLPNPRLQLHSASCGF